MIERFRPSWVLPPRSNGFHRSADWLVSRRPRYALRRLKRIASVEGAEYSGRSFAGFCRARRRARATSPLFFAGCSDYDALPHRLSIGRLNPLQRPASERDSQAPSASVCRGGTLADGSPGRKWVRGQGAPNQRCVAFDSRAHGVLAGLLLGPHAGRATRLANLSNFRCNPFDL